jgi:hypothetical protein
MTRPRRNLHARVWPGFPGQFLRASEATADGISPFGSERRFFLRPDDDTNNAFTYCLALAAKRANVQVTSSVALSNHPIPWCPKTRRGDSCMKSRGYAAWNGRYRKAGCCPMIPATLQFLITMIACAINERMQRKLDYTQEEVRVLKEILAAITGSGRLSFTADQRRRLAVAGKALSPEERKKCCQVVKPETILGWFRQIVARKYDSTKRKVGRPRKDRDIRKLVIDMALANLGWGYTKIRDALRTGLKIEIGRTTVADILAEEGIEPAPEREKKRTWKQFMKMHWETLYGCDFFSVEALGITGTVRYMVFFVIEIKSRAGEIAGIAVDPGEAKEFVEHYHTERFHQGIGGQLIKSQPGSANDSGSNGSIACRSRLGGLLNFYHRKAA